MNHLARAVTALLAALPLPHLSLAVTVGGVHHHGDIVTAATDEECDHHFDPDEPVGTARVMDDNELYAFAEIAGREAIATEDVHRGCREAMAQLALEEAAYRLGDDE